MLGAVAIAFSSILVRLSHASPSTAAISRSGRWRPSSAAGVTYVGFLLMLRRGGVDLRRPAGPLFDATATAAVLCWLAGLVIGDADLAPDCPERLGSSRSP